MMRSGLSFGMCAPRWRLQQRRLKTTMAREPEVERLFTNSWQGYKHGNPVEVRSASDGKMTIGGYAAVFNTRSLPLGGFIEVVERGFFNKSKADNWPGVVCRYDHNNVMLLGTTAS